MANEKTKELFDDKDFLAELSKTKSAEEAQKLIASKGGEISIEELKAIFSAVKSGELNDEALEGVAGGYIQIPGFSYIRARGGYIQVPDWCL